MDSLAHSLVFLTAITSALVGGVLFAFSTFVMPALHRLPTAQGVAAMQSINVTVFTPWVMVPFVGTAPLLVVAAALVWTTSEPGPRPIETSFAALVYAFGCLGITRARNVPRNEHLEKLPAESNEAAEYWAEYVPGWNRWNHARTAACLLASALLIRALTA